MANWLMAQIACSTWDGGGNVAVFRALANQLEARGHEVTLQVGWDEPPELEGDLLLLDHMTAIEGLKAALASGVPTATVVHTLWSFVPSLEGTFAPPGYLDVLGSVACNLVFSVAELDGPPFPTNVEHVGPVFERADDAVLWQPRGKPLVVVSLGTTEMGEAPVLQRVLDGLAGLDVSVVATTGPHIDRSTLRIPPNAEVGGLLPHGVLLPKAEVFVGHGGHGGIMAALAAGVPIVSIPLDRDQPHNAERLEAVGAGTTVANDADGDTIAAAVYHGWRDGEQRRAARRFAETISGYRGAAVARVEALLPANR